MTKAAPANPALDDIANLMLERQRYESWLSSLDARRDSTPEAVFQRVRGDYAARLKTVTEQLVARRAAIQAHVEQLSGRLTQLEAETQRLKEQRAEAELRMQVGELAVTDWNAKARECDESIARLTDAQTQVRTQLAQAKAIVSMVSAQANGGSVSSSATTLPQGQPATPRASRPLSAQQVREAEKAATPRSPTPARGPVNELEFLNSVVGGAPKAPATSPPAQSASSEPPAAASAPAAPPKKAEPEGAPDLAESLVSRVNQGGIANKLREDADAESLLQDPKPKQVIKPAANPLAANVAENDPIVLRPQGGSERHKTLKCSECSTMNYPTEWYCERCGAELSAI